VALLSSDEYDDDHAAAKRAFHGVASGTDLHVWLDRLSELARRGYPGDLVKSKWKLHFYDGTIYGLGGFDLRFYEDRGVPPPELYWEGCERGAALQLGTHRFPPRDARAILEHHFGDKDCRYWSERDAEAELPRRCADAESRPPLPPKGCFWRAVRRADGVHMRIDENQLRMYQIVIRDQRAAAPAKTFDEALAERVAAIPRYQSRGEDSEARDERVSRAVSRNTAELTAERVRRGCVAKAFDPHRVVTESCRIESHCTGDQCGEPRTARAQRRAVRLFHHTSPPSVHASNYRWCKR
jgi:hypothetical protein